MDSSNTVVHSTQAFNISPTQCGNFITWSERMEVEKTDFKITGVVLESLRQFDVKGLGSIRLMKVSYSETVKIKKRVGFLNEKQ